MSLKFEVAQLPKTRNALNRKHWSFYSRERKRWISLVSLATAKQKPKAPLQKVAIKMVRHSSRQPDYDGLVSSFKWVLDALVMCGVIEDDSPTIIKAQEYSWVKAKPRSGKITVEVSSIV